MLLTKLGTKKPGTEWRLIYSEGPIQVTLNTEGKFIAVPAGGANLPIKVLDKTVGDKVPELPRILSQAVHDHRKDIAAPRYKNSKPFIQNDVADELERQFYEKLVAPYVDSSDVYSIAVSGTRLCDRIGVHPKAELFVNHYESNTFQNDRGPVVSNIQAQIASEPDTPVLIIDDMVSSGHTAAAVLKAFENAGVTRVRYVALFDIVASRENFDVDSAITTLIPISNFYWMYGRGMDLMDEQSRNSTHIYGADKTYYDFNTQEDYDDLFNFFNQQS